MSASTYELFSFIILIFLVVAFFFLREVPLTFLDLEHILLSPYYLILEAYSLIWNIFLCHHILFICMYAIGQLYFLILEKQLYLRDVLWGSEAHSPMVTRTI